MELREFVEEALIGIAEGVRAANDKLGGLTAQCGNRVTFTVAVQVSQEKDTRGGGGVRLNVFNAGVEAGNASKSDVYNTVTFEACLSEKQTEECKLPNFSITNPATL